MIVAPTLNELPKPSRRSIVSIGNYDGLHRGHQAVLSTVVRRARRQRGTSTVITFNPHPLKVLHPERAPQMILPLVERIRLAEELGVERLLVLEFTLPFSRTPAAAFVEEVLVKGLRCNEVYLGRNFRFGRDREGGLELLQEMGARHGFRALGAKEVRYKEFIISSTLVRSTLADGQVALTRRLLGRPFTLMGKVVRGEGRGHSLDFPTANLELENEIVPCEGVYITRAVLPGHSYGAATNIGRRPTFGGHQMVTETHLLDCTEDLYGTPLRLEFLRRLRNERTFESPDALRLQIKRDVARARDYFRRLRPRRRTAALKRRAHG